jgi:peptidyl-prolyl cis-trans isomerase B (cyclophilin B)
LINTSNKVDNSTNLNDNNNEQMNTLQTEWLKDWDTVAVMKTDKWTIKIKLFTDLVPVTATNFIALSNTWYYDWLIFHRVIKDFMIQWGDPEWNWTWWESVYWWSFDDEFSEELSNIPYSISMANSWPNTNGSQFFIKKWNNTFLDYDKDPLTSKHSVFWQVVEWKEVVDKIINTKTWTDDKPEKDIKIISIEIKKYENSQLKEYTDDIDSIIEKVKNEIKVKNEAKKNKEVEALDTVSVNYIWTFTDWEEFDNSYDRWQPIQFQVWAWQMIPWFEKWIIWLKIWEKKTIKLSPEEAYWGAEVEIPKTELEPFIDSWVELKDWWEIQTAGWNIKILKVNEDTVILQNNHPLAWKTLIFEIELMDIK